MTKQAAFGFGGRARSKTGPLKKIQVFTGLKNYSETHARVAMTFGRFG